MSKPISFFLLAFLLLSSCKQENKRDLKQNEESEPTTQPIKPPSQILGIDVSHFQGEINWQEIKDAQITFVYDKATEGETYLDPEYLANKAGAHQNNLVHGSYHFYISDDDPITQAEFFLKSIDYGPGDMPPVLDLESGGIKGDVDQGTFQEDVLTWLKHVESNLDVKPIIYTNPTFGDAYLTDSIFADYQLWIAEYGVESPTPPKIWEQNGWLIWQRSERGTIEGAIGQVDHDLYNPQKPFEVIKK